MLQVLVTALKKIQTNELAARPPANIASIETVRYTDG
jgi:hypothetical protein